MPTIVETFVGCGGAHLGFKQNGFETLLVNDTEQNMINTLLKNKAINPDQYFLGSVSDLTNSVLDSKIKKDVDVVFGGIVCKGFSLAGVRNPFDKRNYLYIDQLRIVKHLKPKVSIIENVVGLRNMYLYEKCEKTANVFEEYTKLSDENKNLNGQKSAMRKNGNDYSELTNSINKNKKTMDDLLATIAEYKYKIIDRIRETYENLGYRVYDDVLSVDDYGGFTNRKRLIIVAVRNDIKKEYVFPEKETKKYTLGDCLKLIDYTKSDNDNVPMKHNAKTVERFSMIPEGKNISDVVENLPDDLKISKFYSRGNTQRLHRDRCVPTLVPGHSNFPIHPTLHRQITVREAATITGFPLDYEFFGSHTSRCEQIGNAVPVHLSNALAKSVLSLIDNN